MALAFDLIEIPTRLAMTGIAWRLMPGRDASGIPWGYSSEVQRAPDSAGSPDVANAETIAYLGALPAAGGVFVDPRALSSGRWHYRWRHTGLGVDPGTWSGWKSALPALIPKDVFGVSFDKPTVHPIMRSEKMSDEKYALVAATNTGVSADASVQLDPGNGIKEGGVVFKLYRHREEITVQGPIGDPGDVVVTFAQTYQNVPLIFARGGQYVTYSSVLTSAVTQRLRLQVLNPTASGFTSRTQIVNTGATTAQNDDFPDSNELDAVGETTEADLDPAGANDNTYTVHYYVEVTLSSPGVDPLVTLTVAIDSNDGGGWVERATFTYARSTAGTSTWTEEQKPITVSGLGLNDDIRLRAKSFVVHDATGSFKVRGGDGAGGHAASFNGVTYTTATDDADSAIPAAGDHAIWVAQEVT